MAHRKRRRNIPIVYAVKRKEKKKKNKYRCQIKVLCSCKNFDWDTTIIEGGFLKHVLYLTPSLKKPYILNIKKKKTHEKCNSNIYLATC